MTQQRLLGADFLRAAACILVLMHHLAFRMDGGNIPDWARGTMQFLVMGSFGVSVFFVLSGFLLARPFWLVTSARITRPASAAESEGSSRYTLRYGVSIKPYSLTRPYVARLPIRPMLGPSGVSMGQMRP